MTTPDELDGAEIERVVARLSPARIRCLFALSGRTDVWMTVSEMRPSGATGSGMDLLYVMHSKPQLCERRWATWGADRINQQLRGEGYEYAITAAGKAVKAHLARTGHPVAGGGAKHGGEE